ncbi:hypothetical protein GE09DRAFT_1249522 [Coniochaeta sp. 2T2.1]|nr:hypothetical protein GE09DRAFT_1249522 [Coniochaeta sp. 2T2.1]
MPLRWLAEQQGLGLYKPDWSCVAHNDYSVSVLPETPNSVRSGCPQWPTRGMTTMYTNGARFGQELHQGYDEGAVNEDEEEDEDDEDSQTVVPPTNTKKKPLQVKVKKHLIKRTLYFADSKGREVETSASAWTKVQGGYLLTNKKHAYFTKSLP